MRDGRVNQNLKSLISPRPDVGEICFLLFGFAKIETSRAENRAFEREKPKKRTKTRREPHAARRAARDPSQLAPRPGSQSASRAASFRARRASSLHRSPRGRCGRAGQAIAPSSNGVIHACIEHTHKRHSINMSARCKQCRYSRSAASSCPQSCPLSRTAATVTPSSPGTKIRRGDC